jgi:sugar phosphate isomerase/epimerase
MSGTVNEARFVRPGYHAGGLLHHDCATVIGELASLGFAVVAIRPSAATLHPSRDDFEVRWEAIVSAARRSRISLVIDLDGFYVHQPFQRRGWAIASEDELQSIAAAQWIERWAEIADHSGQDGSVVTGITFSTGRISDPNKDSRQERLEWVAERLDALDKRLGSVKTRLAIRPVFGDAIASVADWLAWKALASESSRFGLAADVGEMILGGEIPIADPVLRAADSLFCVYLCDRSGSQPSGIRGDLPIGRGEVATDRIIRTLGRGGFAGPAIYRVDGHAEEGLDPARSAIAEYEAIV